MFFNPVDRIWAPYDSFSSFPCSHFVWLFSCSVSIFFPHWRYSFNRHICTLPSFLTHTLRYPPITLYWLVNVGVGFLRGLTQLRLRCASVHESFLWLMMTTSVQYITGPQARPLCSPLSWKGECRWCVCVCVCVLCLVFHLRNTHSTHKQLKTEHIVPLVAKGKWKTHFFPP